MKHLASIGSLVVLISNIWGVHSEKDEWIAQPEPVYSKPEGSTIHLHWMLKHKSNYTRYNFAKLENGISRDYIVKHVTSSYTQSKDNIQAYDGIFLAINDVGKGDIGDYELTVSAGVDRSTLISEKVHIHVTDHRGDVQEPQLCITQPTVGTTTTTESGAIPIVVPPDPREVAAQSCDDNGMYKDIAIVLLSIICFILLILTIVLPLLVYIIMKKGKHKEPDNMNMQNLSLRVEQGNRPAYDETDLQTQATPLLAHQLGLIPPGHTGKAEQNNRSESIDCEIDQVPEEAAESEKQEQKAEVPEVNTGEVKNNNEIGRVESRKPSLKMTRFKDEPSTDEKQGGGKGNAGAGKDESDGTMRPRLKKAMSITDYHWEIKAVTEKEDYKLKGHRVLTMTLEMEKNCTGDLLPPKLF